MHHPHCLSPLVGLTRVGKYPSPLVGKVGIGEPGLSSPPPEPSPVKGEGSGSQVPHMTDLPLSALVGEDAGEGEGKVADRAVLKADAASLRSDVGHA
jgi:hypothetical protein